ncbi:MAG: ABC transporter permease, partial [Gemmatimonadota bacterium]
MLQLLRLLHLPFWRRSPAGFLLPALGVALGVATVVAIDLAGAGAVRSFRDTVERLDGRTTHRVGGVGGAPVEDGLARRLAELPGVVAAAPVMEGVGLHVAPGAGGEETGEGLRLLGIDPLSEGAIRSLGVEGATGGTAVSAGGGQREAEEREDLFRAFLGEPGALLVSAPFLRRHALEAGDLLSLVVGARRRSAHVLAALPEEVGGLPVPDNLAVGDVATLQELTGRVRGVDRVDLVLAREDRSGVERRVRAALPTGARLHRPGAQAGRLERGLAAFRANVRALSYLALFVSVFLIYNSLLISVLRRRPMLGIARCLGATRRQVLAGWMGEALLTGVVGAAAGVSLGIAFARPALREVARTAQDLYGAMGRGSLAVDAGTLAKAVAVGLAFTLLSALLPAAEAAGTPPAHTAARSGVERAARGGRRVARGVAALLGCLAAAALAWPTASATPGYAAAVLLALTAALLVPDGVELATRAALSRRFGLPGGVARMAAANIRANRSRTGVAVAALTVALAMSVAMA